MVAILVAILLLGLPVTAGANAVFEAFPDLPDFVQPVGVVDPMDGTDRLFVPQLGGVVYVFANDPAVFTRSVFLDISADLTGATEGGLLCLAFHPSFRTNGYCYVTYTVDNPRREVLARYTADPARPDTVLAGSKLIITEIPKAFLNHNAGQIAFGPDGYLYWTLGDDLVIRYAQDLTQWNGKLLRIDVDHPGGGNQYSVPPDNPFVNMGGSVHPEIYAFGFRNPWRFSFDPPTKRLWMADVGEDTWEEIDIVHKGRNYGWNRMEGTMCFQPSSCDTIGLNLASPLYEYPHPAIGGSSITGGYVYRGSRQPSMVGKYIYADYITGLISALTWNGVDPPSSAPLDTLTGITSFGVDKDREIFIVSFDGNVYRLFDQPAEPPLPKHNALVAVQPNPFRSQATVAYALSRDGRADLDVFDVAGRRIVRISDPNAPAGPNTLQWDGRDARGVEMSSGVYFVRLSVDGVVVDSRRIVRLK